MRALSNWQSAEFTDAVGTLAKAKFNPVCKRGGDEVLNKLFALARRVVAGGAGLWPNIWRFVLWAGRDGSLGKAVPAASEVTDDGLGCRAPALTEPEWQEHRSKGNSLCEFLG